MNLKGKRNIQNISCCSLAIFAGIGVYLGMANTLGVSKMPALLLGLAITIAMLLLYRFLIGKVPSDQAAPYLGLLLLPGILVIISLNYCGMISLWKELAIVDTPFLYYALLAAALLALTAYRGDKGLWRTCPLLCLLIIIIVFFDTIFILTKAEPVLFFEGITKPAGQIVWGSAEIAAALLAPGLLFLLLVFDQKKNAPFSAKDLGKGLIFPVVYLLVELSRDLLLFGDLIALDRYPIIRTLKTVYFGVGVSRLEFIGITVLSFGALAAIMMEFIVFTRITEKIFKLKKYYLIAIEVTLVIILSAFFYFYRGGLIWIIAEVAAILLLFTYPVILILKKRRQ